MKLKSKKSALLLSFTSLLLCFAMLAGSTFAWFTDTATTGVNQIKSGNLDIEVTFAKEKMKEDGTLAGEMTEYKPIEAATDIFDANALWEPGRTEYVAFLVENKGNLALKYQFSLNITAQKAGTNKAGEEYMLANYLCASAKAQNKGFAIDSGNDPNLPFMAKANDLNMAGVEHVMDPENKPLTTMAPITGELKAGEKQAIGMAVWMPTDVGNEANPISSDKAATIDLRITVVATQLNHENDSFGPNYDKDATYPVIVSNQQQANDAITNATDKKANISIASGQTITLDNGIAHEGDKSRDITFSGDGSQTVNVATEDVGENNNKLNYQRGSIFTFENLTIQAGEGDFDGIVCDELTYKNCTIKGKLTLYGKATFINCVFDNTMANQYSIWTWGGTDVTFEDCTFNTNGKAILLYGQATEAKPTNLVANNCTFNDRNNGAAGKAAIEIGNDYNATYTLTVNNAAVNGFADGKNTGSKIWANKNSMDAAHLTVTIDGSKIQ